MPLLHTTDAAGLITLLHLGDKKKDMNMTINSINLDNVRMIKGMTITDEFDRTFYKIRAYTLQELDLKTFRNRQEAQDYLAKIAEEVTNKDADTVIVSEL